MDDEIRVEIIPPIMVHIVARQTEMERSYIEKIESMMSHGELVLLAARRQVDNFIDNYIGRVSLWLTHPEEPEVWRYARDAVILDNLYVNERARSQGIAKALIDAAEAEAKRRGRTTVAIGVEPDNMTARKLCESLGYGYLKCGDSDTYTAELSVTDDQGKPHKQKVARYLYAKQL